MNNLREFIIKDVRCFEGEQRANIRPITLLVGENSTGKTSFLGSYRVLHRALSGHQHAPFTMRGHFDFNEEPFQMGAFRDIFRSKRGNPDRKEEFVLGFSMGNGDERYNILLTFVEKGSEPTVSSLCLHLPDKSSLKIQTSKDKSLLLKIPNHTIKINPHFDDIFFLFCVVLGDLLNLQNTKGILDFLGIKGKDAEILNKFIKSKSAINSKSKEEKKSTRYFSPDLFGQEKSIAPLRSKPKRTYDPTTEVPTAKGKHIPMLMMRLLRTKDKKWDTLHDDLVEFGRESGLFSEIKIKSHGRKINDPFQLQVKVRTGPQSNIIDVGYGINQILPILVEIIHSVPTTFLLQQPEVHLHPRAQAEFSTFLAKSVSKKQHSFLIETHSDYIIDRMRMSVRDKIIKPDDVSILYFEPEKKGGAVKIHNIKVDNQGNLIDTPPGYRDFFMKESDKLLGFS